MSSSSLSSGVTEKIVCQNKTTLCSSTVSHRVLHEKAGGATLKTSNSTKEVKENLKKRWSRGIWGVI